VRRIESCFISKRRSIDESESEYNNLNGSNVSTPPQTVQRNLTPKKTSVNQPFDGNDNTAPLPTIKEKELSTLILSFQENQVNKAPLVKRRKIICDLITTSDQTQEQTTIEHIIQLLAHHLEYRQLRTFTDVLALRSHSSLHCLGTRNCKPLS
jgi:hypothetical protein